MIIPRPTHNDYLTPVDSTPVLSGNQARHRAWVEHLFSLPTWKCTECGTTMFGTCERCVWCWHKFRKVVPRN